MTNLLTNYAITNSQNNNLLTSQNKPSAPTIETRNMLWTACMSAILGGTWCATPKFDATTLLTMDNDTFEKNTQKTATKLPAEFATFKTLRQELREKESSLVDFFFENETEITKETLLKKVKESSEDTLAQSIKNLEEKLAKTIKLDFNTFFNNFTSVENLNDNNKKSLKEALGKTLFNEILKKQPSNIKEYIENQYTQLEQKRACQEFCNICTNGKLSKDMAQIRIRTNLLNDFKIYINNCYNDIKSKLPKRRLSSAVKWFAIGAAISVIVDTIFNSKRKKN